MTQKPTFESQTPSVSTAVGGTDSEVRTAAPGLYLRESTEGLLLTDDEQEFHGDFTRLLPRLKHNNLTHEILVRAAKLKNAPANPKSSDGTRLIVVDATAGMGEDSLLLAAAGFDVYLFEKDPVIAALLCDTLARAREIPELSGIASRMFAAEGDSVAALAALPFEPDVVLLDPMFPERKKSGLIKKKFQLLQQLERPSDAAEESALLEAAIQAGPRKIVIKRPAKGPYLAGRKPDYSLDGKAIRYDVLVFARPSQST